MHADPPELAAAKLTIGDVPVFIVFPGTGFESRTPSERQEFYTMIRREMVRSDGVEEVALVWLDSSGTTRFIARPQQHPFFRIMRYEQLYAQVDRTLPLPKPA